MRTLFANAYVVTMDDEGTEHDGGWLLVRDGLVTREHCCVDFDGGGPADDGVEKPCMEASVLVTGQIDDDSDGPVDPDPRRPPNMFVHSEGFHTLQAVGVAGARLGFDLDRIPAGMPVHTEMPGQR